MCLVVSESHWGSGHWVLGDAETLRPSEDGPTRSRDRDPGPAQSSEEAAPRGSPGAPQGSGAPQAGHLVPRGTGHGAQPTSGACKENTTPAASPKGRGHSNELATRSSCDAPEASGFWNLALALMNPPPRQEWAAGPRRGRLRMTITWGAL